MLNYSWKASPNRWGRPEFNATFSIGFGNGLAAPRLVLPLAWSEEAKTELLPLRVIMAMNRWRLGCESLGDAGREMSYVLTSAEVLPKTKVAL